MENPVITILKEQDTNRPEMSRKTGIAYQTVYFLSTGLTRKPQQKTFERLAKFGNKDVKQLKSDWKQWKKENLEED